MNSLFVFVVHLDITSNSISGIHQCAEDVCVRALGSNAISYIEMNCNPEMDVNEIGLGFRKSMWGQVNRCSTFGMQVASCIWEEALK